MIVKPNSPLERVHCAAFGNVVTIVLIILDQVMGNASWDWGAPSNAFADNSSKEWQLWSIFRNRRSVSTNTVQFFL
jgi:hypothetical protein